MTCFEIIKEALDEIYLGLPSENRDDLIKTQLSKLSATYDKLSKGAVVDYSDPVTRFAYVFRYVTSHANMVYRKIDESNHLRGLFSKDELTMTCVGGGPGSDFLGVLKYLNDNDLKPRLKCNLLDSEILWLETWCDVDSKIVQDFNINKTAFPFNILDIQSWSKLSKYLDADIFTFVYFISEVCAKKDANVFFDNLFQRVKKGAYILFIDNNATDFFGWFDGFADKYSYNVIQSENHTIKMTLDEQKNVLNNYIEKFGPPKLKGDIAHRILQKP